MLPWANLDSPTGPARETGLSDALLSVEATPVKTSNVKRSDGSGVKRRSLDDLGRATVPRRTATKPTRRQCRGRGRTRPGRSSPPTSPPTVSRPCRPSWSASRPSSARRSCDRVKNARELGDLRENADYEAARNEQSFLEGRILELEQRLRTAVVIEARERWRHHHGLDAWSTRSTAGGKS